MKHTRILYVLVAVALAVAVLGIVLPRPEAAGDLMTFGGRPQRFGYIAADKLRVANDAEIVGTAQVDTINEQSSGSGVTIDGLTIQDGGLGEALSVSGAITPTRLFVDGAGDAVQLNVQGYTTQTSSLAVLEQSDGTDVFVVDGSGNVSVMGEFDEALMVDGEADEAQLTIQGYTTQTLSLAVFEQSDGTDVATISNAGALDVAGSVTYGANDRYPMGFASSGYVMYCAQSAFTGTQVITAATHSVTTPTAVLESMASAPGATAGDPFLAHSIWAGSTITLTAVQDDATVATKTVTLDWCVIGQD